MQTTHGYLPFRSLYGFDPRMIHVNDDYTSKLSFRAAEDWLDRVTGVYIQIQHTLKQINKK